MVCPKDELFCVLLMECVACFERIPSDIGYLHSGIYGGVWIVFDGGRTLEVKKRCRFSLTLHVRPLKL